MEPMKNIHLEHLEDFMFTNGATGWSQGISTLRELANWLSGSGSTASADCHMSIKYDGSPAIIAGVDEEDEKFFVASKSVFNKVPILYKTHDAIDGHLAGTKDLAYIFHLALNLCRHLDLIPGERIQGDVMFTDKSIEYDLSTQTHKFRPNTIRYSVPNIVNLNRGGGILLGIIWHTMYTKDFTEFAIDIPKMSPHKNLLWMHPCRIDQTVKYTKLEKKVVDFYNTVETDLNILEDLYNLGDLQKLFFQFINMQIKQGINPHIQNNVPDFIAFIAMHYTKEIANRKTAKAVEKLLLNQQACLRFFYRHKENAINENLFWPYLQLRRLKNDIVEELDRADSLFKKDFYNKKTYKYIETGNEGYVFSTNDPNRSITEYAVKLVCREEFSWANFNHNIRKGWER
tara:strand:+ start:3662 stop:4864 length:1203 start_codon:yes stop_codon:yes gene_type:complete